MNTFKQAAIAVLKKSDKPLHYKEIPFYSTNGKNFYFFQTSLGPQEKYILEVDHNELKSSIQFPDNTVCRSNKSYNVKLFLGEN